MMIFTTLQESMTRDHSAVHSDRNPVVNNHDGNKAYLAYAIGQYVWLVRMITRILSDGLNVACEQQANGDAQYDDVVEALLKNIGEETGSETAGVPHARILIEECRKYGIELVDGVPLGGASEAFLAYMRNLASDNTAPTRALGVIYALECTATPELLLVRPMLETLIGQRLEGALNLFFLRHTEIWEPGHEEDLRLALGGLADRNPVALASGFESTLSAMDRWWEGIHQEATKQ